MADQIQKYLKEIETNANMIRNSPESDVEYRARIILEAVRRIKAELVKMKKSQTNF